MNMRFNLALKKLEKATLIVLVSGLKALSRLLPYRSAVAIGGFLGRLSFFFLRRERQRSVDHLFRAFPLRDRQWRRATVRGMFVHLGKCLLETLAATPGRIEAQVEWVGEENLHAAMARGKGLVFVAGHIGNWEIMAGAVGARYPLSVVAAPIEPEYINNAIVGLRSAIGVRTIVRSRPGASKELIRAFRENRILGLLIDQDTDVEGVFVDFLGMPAWTPSAAAQMAFRFDAPVVFGYARRLDGDRHRITIEGPIEFTRTGDLEADVLSATALLTKRIEAAVLSAPEQWVWMHRRWRRQP